MLNWIDELFNNAITQVANGISKLYQLAANIDTITFDEMSWIYQFIGLIRYVLGEPLFLALAVFFDIGLGFILYKILKRIVELMGQIFTKIKGKFIIP